MPIEPLTLLLLAGGAMLLAGKKKSTTKPEPEPEPEPEPPVACPPGFIWSDAQQSCIPHLSPEEPPQLHITGDCEAWQMLPSVQGWFAKYAQPKFEAFVAGVGGQPSPDDFEQRIRGTGGIIEAHDMAVAILAQSPIAFASDEFPNFGSLCPLPVEVGDPGVPAAMHDLYVVMLNSVRDGILNFNQTAEPVLPIPEGS